MKRTRTLLLSVLVVVLAAAVPAGAEQIVVRLIQASNKQGAPDPQLSDLLPDLQKTLRWSHYRQVAAATVRPKETGTDRLILGPRLKLELTYKGLLGRQLALDVKLFLDDRVALTGSAKLGDKHICIGGPQADNEAWLLSLQRR